MVGKATELTAPVESPEEIPGGFFSGVEDRLLMLQQIAGKAAAATKADLATIERRAAAMQSLVAQDDEVLAKYKIEVHYDKKRRTDRNAFPGIIMVWKTGVLSGGGDEILYPCPDDACKGYIDFESRTQTGQTLCPTCRRLWQEKDLREIRGYKRDLNGWAHIVCDVFNRLGGQADVFLKMHEGDIRQASVLESLRERRGDDLYDARKKVVLRYALNAILKDTVRRTQESAFKAFLGA